MREKRLNFEATWEIRKIFLFLEELKYKNISGSYSFSLCGFRHTLLGNMEGRRKKKKKKKQD